MLPVAKLGGFESEKSAALRRGSFPLNFEVRSSGRPVAITTDRAFEGAGG